MKRDKTVLVRLSAEEREMVEELARKKGLSLSDVIRQSIRKWSALEREAT